MNHRQAHQYLAWPIVDEPALVKFYGTPYRCAALDTFDIEPLPKDHPSVVG